MAIITKDMQIAPDMGAVAETVDTRRMSVTAVISTNRIDNEGDLMEQGDAVDTSDHERNPVVLWSHLGNRYPIGKATSPEGIYTVQKMGDRTVSTTFFSQATREANEIFALIAEGILRGVSVGFLPVDFTRMPESKDSIFRGLHYKRWRLLEYSHCPVPMNPDALVTAFRKSMVTSEGLRRSLEGLLPRRKAWAPGMKFKAAPVKAEVPPADLQAVLCPVEDYATVDEARKWCEAHQYACDRIERMKVEPAGEAFAAVQFNPEECEPDSGEARELAEGVFGLYCRRKGNPYNPDTSQETKVSEQKNDQPPAEKPGIKFLKDLKAKLDEGLSQIEHPDIQKMCEDMLGLHKAACKKAYVSIDFGHKADATPPPPPPEPSPPAEETIDFDAVTKSLADLKGDLAGVKDEFYSLTGKK